MDVDHHSSAPSRPSVKRFQPEKGFRLATYAMWWIKASAAWPIKAESGAPYANRPIGGVRNR